MNQSPSLPVPPVNISRRSSCSSIQHGVADAEEHHSALLSPTLHSHRRPSQDAMIPKIQTPIDQSSAQKRHSQCSEMMKRLESEWMIEAVLLVCSAICMISIVVFLCIHHNSPLASWTFYFSLNTVISVLGTLFRSTLLMAVSAALAQGKWTWFRKRDSPLSTFEAIDAGSRETLGSFKLLWHMRAQHLVSAGAVVLALGFLIEPFLQAIISDYGRLVPVKVGMNAIIGKLERFDGGTQCITPWPARPPNVSTTPDFGVSAAFFDGLNAATGGGIRNVTFSCASGNCTWPERVSLAVCGSCFDISTHLKKIQADLQTALLERGTSNTAAPFSTFLGLGGKNGSTGFPTATMYGTMPAVAVPTAATAATIWSLDHMGLSLQNYDQSLRSGNGSNQGTIFQAKVVADQNQTINFKDSQTMLAAFTMMRAEDGYIDGNVSWQKANVTATECALSLCLNVYRSFVSDGILKESVVATASEKVRNSWLPEPDVKQQVLQLDGLATDDGTLDFNPVYHKVFLYRNDFQLNASGLKRSNTEGSYTLTQKALVSTINFLTSLIPEDKDTSLVNVVVSSSSSDAEYAYGSPLLQPLCNSKNLSGTFDTIATSMSNAMRDLGNKHLQGDTLQWVIHYRVRWPFLALPLSLILIGTIFLVLSILDAHRNRVPVWKSNSIAVMIHGPDEALRQQLRNFTHDHSLSAAAAIAATLEDLDDGPALLAPHQLGAELPRPRTPSRDEEEVEMAMLKPPTTPQTPGSTTTLVESRPSEEQHSNRQSEEQDLGTVSQTSVRSELERERDGILSLTEHERD